MAVRLRSEMKTFRRVGFVALTVGAFALPLAILIEYSHWEASANLGLTGFISLFGLQIWSAVFIKSEPNFARLGVIVVTLVAAGLWLYMATHPDFSD